ncbi:hypothetical protein [Thermoflexus hugenholtzii]
MPWLALLIVFVFLVLLFLFGISLILGMERIALYIWAFWPAPLRRIADLPAPVIAWGLTGGLIGVLMGWIRVLARTARWGRGVWWIFSLIPIGLLLIGFLAFLEGSGALGSGSR